MAQPQPLSRHPTATVRAVLAASVRGLLGWLCSGEVPRLPCFTLPGSLADDQAWARPPKPPTFGEFLSQHKAEVSSRRRRRSSRPQAKALPRAYRWERPSPAGTLSSPPRPLAPALGFGGLVAGFEFYSHLSPCPLPTLPARAPTASLPPPVHSTPGPPLCPCPSVTTMTGGRRKRR